MDKRQKREKLKDMVDRILADVEKPTLANPAMATHTVLMFAIENMAQFTEWVNDGAGETPDDPPKTVEEIERYLQMLHRIIDTAVSAAHIVIPGEPTPFLPGVRIMRAPHRSGDPGDDQGPLPGMYL